MSAPITINDTETKWSQSRDDLSQHTARPNQSIPIEVLDKFDISKYNPTKSFGNPTPLALAGLVLCLTPLAAQLMGWRGADGSGSANNGAHFFCGGVLLLLGGILEFFLGNTFAFVVFGSYGGFFLSLGATLTPGFGVLAPYTTESGALNHAFYNSFGFFYLFTGLLSVVFLICSLRTNIVFVGIFLAYSIAFPLLAASDWAKGMGNEHLGHTLLVAGGAACFVVAMLGWYALLSSLLQSVDFPFDLPMGDLSNIILGKQQRKRLQEEKTKGV
ncbi:GPR1/FUN34/yaaH family-domain-containing protein [Pyronema omphalodes]|nr:GPR1/FUN34/yaaH family-domain-containing protein [Pyronema omphalodes]